MTARIRTRRQDDLELLILLLHEVHAADRYPLHWPANPRSWLTPNGVLRAWVTEDGSALTGHVALCSTVNYPAATVWSAACGLHAKYIAAVALLFVAPGARGQGLGAALLNEARAEAGARGLRPALEVLDHDRKAIALYERAGWKLVSSDPASWARTEAERPLLHYYVSAE